MKREGGEGGEGGAGGAGMARPHSSGDMVGMKRGLLFLFVVFVCCFCLLFLFVVFVCCFCYN